MERLNESTQVFNGYFKDSTTFVDEDGKAYKLIPTVIDDVELDDKEIQKVLDLDPGTSPSDVQDNPFNNWKGPTNKKKGRVVVDIEEPDVTKTFIDDNTGKAYKWDNSANRFVEISDGE